MIKFLWILLLSNNNYVIYNYVANLLIIIIDLKFRYKKSEKGCNIIFLYTIVIIIIIIIFI